MIEHGAEPRGGEPYNAVPGTQTVKKRYFGLRCVGSRGRFGFSPVVWVQRLPNRFLPLRIDHVTVERKGKGRRPVARGIPPRGATRYAAMLAILGNVPNVSPHLSIRPRRRASDARLR
jgi:hypothetical protein